MAFGRPRFTASGFGSNAWASTFFMTPGNGSSSRSRLGVKRMPAGAFVARPTRATKTVSPNGKCVKTWRTTPGSRFHRASNGASSRAWATS